MIQKFRKKPVVVEAVQYKNDNHKEIIDFTEGAAKLGVTYPILYIETLEGNQTVSDGDWVIKGVAGEFYPCKPDIFNRTYKLVQEGER